MTNSHVTANTSKSVSRNSPQKALVIVDVQEDFVEGGSLAVEGGRELAVRIADSLLAADHEYDLLVTTQDWHIEPGGHFSDKPDFVKSWPPHCVAFTKGAELLPVLKERLGQQEHLRESFFKGKYEDAYSGFMGANIEGYSLAHVLHAHDIDEVDVVGIAGNYCVKSTAIDSVQEGFKTRVLKDYVAWIQNGTEEEALEELKWRGVTVV